jgi:hypothetical protein
MTILETKVFTYSELSESAKETAREWYRSASQGDNFYAEYVYEDASQIAALMGIDLCQTRTKTGTCDPTSYSSGFSSQGDGASYECRYKYEPGALKAVTAYSPKDAELHRIAKDLQDIQKRYFYKLVANSRVIGHYVHSGCMRVSVEHSDDSYRDISDAEDTVTQCLRDFADWIYSQLEKAYDWENSDEQIAETILRNEYEFTEDGDKV